MKAKAIVFEAPHSLTVRELELAPMGPRDLEVTVAFSGISTGTERGRMWLQAWIQGADHAK